MSDKDLPRRDSFGNSIPGAFPGFCQRRIGARIQLQMHEPFRPTLTEPPAVGHGPAGVPLKLHLRLTGFGRNSYMI
ncbi:MAG: hypothetical protein EA390_07335 [Balneolaceae bacterium]|nr:MAG: hypothetical protein EA390_07335 [Balneolaceae bacterium]